MELPDHFDIRYTEDSDIVWLQEWFSDLSVREPFPFETDLEMEEALKNWMGFAKFQAGLTGTINHIPCALGLLFLMPYRKVAHHASFMLIVPPMHRRKGIGTSMVKNLLHLGKTRFSLESVHVEILEPNPCIPFLKKLGFREYARQDHFVQRGEQAFPRVLLECFF